MAYEIGELREQLIADESLRILFVEGVQDLQLWRKLIDDDERDCCTVYPISEVKLVNNQDNNRQRCLDLAAITSGWLEADRVIFFIDADNDHLLGMPSTPRVVLTDFRDLESYALTPPIFEKVCVIGLAATVPDSHLTIQDITAAVRPIGALRALSQRDNLRLPFKRAFPDAGIKRVWSRTGHRYSCSITGVIIALLNRQYGSAARAQAVTSDLQTFMASIGAFDDKYVVHGKDLVAFLSKKYGVDVAIISGTIRLSLQASDDTLRQFPSIMDVRNRVLH
jgi:hypothetical protein